jgi:hypothetical protein
MPFAVAVYVRGDVDGERGAVLKFPKKARTPRPSILPRNSSDGNVCISQHAAMETFNLC